MRLVALVLPVLIVASIASPARSSVMIEVDKTTQHMVVTVDGVQRWTWPVSTGRSGHGTPSGTFRAFRLEEDHYSKEWDDAPMPHSIFFTDRGHAIHGSYETRRLGSPASAGCVRLAPENAAKLFALVKERGVTSTKVTLTGSEVLFAQRNPQRAAPVATARRTPTQGDMDRSYYAARGVEYGSRGAVLTPDGYRAPLPRPSYPTDPMYQARRDYYRDAPVYAYPPQYRRPRGIFPFYARD